LDYVIITQKIRKLIQINDTFRKIETSAALRPVLKAGEEFDRRNLIGK
jgi:hypothetical protein